MQIPILFNRGGCETEMNLKPAPFSMTPARVAALLGEHSGADVRYLPIASIALVDQPCRSEDPRLAKENDDGGVV